MKSTLPLHTEIVLIQLLQKHDKSAFDYLYRQYSPGLYIIVCKILKTTLEADDVIQESFLKIWKNIGSYHSDKGTLFTWLLNVTRNTAIDRVRANAKFKTQISWDLVGEQQYIGNAICYPEPMDLDWKWLISDLTVDKKLAIETIYLLGYTQQQAAGILDLPLGTIKTRVRAALQDISFRAMQAGLSSRDLLD